MNIRKLNKTLERRFILTLFQIEEGQFSYLLFLFRKFQKRYKRDIMKDLIDFILMGENYFEGFFLDMMFCFIGTVVGELNKKYSTEFRCESIDVDPNFKFTFGIDKYYLEDYEVPEEISAKILREVKYWEQFQYN